MVGRGKARATRAGPAVTPEASDQAPQYVIDLFARIQAMEERFADSSGSAPHRQPEPQPVIHQVAQPVPVVQTSEQESWLRLMERFQKLRAPEFHGGSDPLVADKWKEDMDSALSYMGVDSVQCQRLAAFILKGDASKWYRSHFSAAERLTTTWEDFLRSFDQQFISSAVTLHPDGYGDATGGHIRGVGILSVCTRGLDIKNIQSAEARV